jgi:tRNA (mo5U34)-methyltransferase
LRDGLPELGGVSLTDIEWYHTIDLRNGEITPGFLDHRHQLDLYGLPESLEGMRCLDAATCDGFWAFEMERRGASEVIGIDVLSLADCDFPANWRADLLMHRRNQIKGQGFAYAKRALNSKVTRRALSIYDLSPARIGTFDFVFMSDVLLHLKEPLRALEALRTVARGDGIVADMYDPDLEPAGFPVAARLIMSHERPDDFSGYFWWSHSPTFLQSMCYLAGFTKVEQVATLTLDTPLGYKIPKVVFKVGTS